MVIISGRKDDSEQRPDYANILSIFKSCGSEVMDMNQTRTGSHHDTKLVGHGIMHDENLVTMLWNSYARDMDSTG